MVAKVGGAIPSLGIELKRRDMDEKNAFIWKIKGIRKRNDPVEILQFLMDNACKLHYPLESVLITDVFTFKDLIKECIAGNKPVFLVDKDENR